MLKILTTCSRLSSLALPIRRLELAVAAHTRFVVFNWIHTTNSHNLSDKQNQNATENGKRKRDSSNSSSSPSNNVKRTKSKTVSKTPSPSVKPRKLGATPKIKPSKLSPGASKKAEKRQLKDTPGKKKKKEEAENINDVEEKNNHIENGITEEKNKKEESTFSTKKSKSNEVEKVKKSAKKKWSKIVQLVDSSDDETHLSLPESPKKSETDNEEKKTESVDKSSNINKNVSDNASYNDANESASNNEEKNLSPKKESTPEKSETPSKNESSKKESTPEKSQTPSKDENPKKEPTPDKKAKKVPNFFMSKQKGDAKGDKVNNGKSANQSYNPSASVYHPIDDACWKRGDKTPYSAFARTLEIIEETSARLKIIEILSNYFRSVIVLSPEDLLPSVYLCLNQLAPAYEGVEFGIADTNLMKAIAQCTGRTLAQIRADVQEVGDLGIIAENSKSNQRTMFQPAPLTVPNVYSRLMEIAQMTGHASLSKKLDKIQTLFVACRNTEARYLVRLLAGKLRIGLAEQSVLQVSCLRYYTQNKINIQLSFSSFSLILIHVADDGQIKIYSRNQEDNTTKYPDIIKRFKNSRGDEVKNCILDCEAVAWDSEKKQILPFQILSTRKRKDANEEDIKVQVCVFMFDLLYLNDEPLVKEPFVKRRELLKQHFKEMEGEWKFANSLDASTMEEVEVFLDESVKGNCEGLMVKTLEKEATYEIAKRSRNWLKLKKDYLDGVGDTLDVVVIGGYIGKGKRTGTYGGFLLACYDLENEEYQSICKIGTGFKEDDLENHTKFFKDHIVPQVKSYYRFDSSHEPDHWFEPVQVWEIKCADLSLSPVHRAAIGIVDPEKGISLRFPRFIRIREDKACEQATSAQDVANMYNNQEQIKNKTPVSKATEEDFY
ncbi:DNLI1 ligase, partial [Acromyrmex heyeri]